MGILKINHISNNLEILSKLMNSVATKYDCSVKYDPDNSSMNFRGEDTLKRFIAEETMELFNKQ